MLSLVKERISRPDAKEGFILDGYPRNIQQAQQLEKVLDPNMELSVVNIQVPQEAIVKRIAGRRTCPECQRVYNVHFHPPKNNEKCDQCGVELFRRKDDEEHVVRKRIATYKRETLPLIDYYRKRGNLYTVKGAQPKEKVAKEIEDLVERKR
jgi:adenylate kinase